MQNTSFLPNNTHTVRQQVQRMEQQLQQQKRQQQQQQGASRENSAPHNSPWVRESLPPPPSPMIHTESESEPRWRRQAPEQSHGQGHTQPLSDMRSPIPTNWRNNDHHPTGQVAWIPDGPGARSRGRQPRMTKSSWRRQSAQQDNQHSNVNRQDFQHSDDSEEKEEDAASRLMHPPPHPVMWACPMPLASRLPGSAIPLNTGTPPHAASRQPQYFQNVQSPPRQQRRMVYPALSNGTFPSQSFENNQREYEQHPHSSQVQGISPPSPMFTQHFDQQYRQQHTRILGGQDVSIGREFHQTPQHPNWILQSNPSVSNRHYSHYEPHQQSNTTSNNSRVLQRQTHQQARRSQGIGVTSTSSNHANAPLAEGTMACCSPKPSPEETDSQEDLCVVCMENPRNASIIHGDSGHIVCCLDCANILKAKGNSCPVCRAAIDLVVKNYY